MDLPLRIELRRSRQLPLLLVLLHGLALAGIVCTPWPPFWRLLLACALAGNFGLALRRVANTPAALWLYAEGEFRLEPRGTERAPDARLSLNPGVLALPFLYVFSGRDDEGRRHDLALARDSATPDALRQLAVWLRHIRTP